MMTRELTEEAWFLYLKTLEIDLRNLDVERITAASFRHEERIFRLMDNAYYRYLRRLEAWALEINAFDDINGTAVNVGMTRATSDAAKTKPAHNLEYNEGQSNYVPKDTAILMAVSSKRHS